MSQYIKVKSYYQNINIIITKNINKDKYDPILYQLSDTIEYYYYGSSNIDHFLGFELTVCSDLSPFIVMNFWFFIWFM